MIKNLVNRFTYGHLYADAASQRNHRGRCEDAFRHRIEVAKNIL
jgi:hypothetical protein